MIILGIDPGKHTGIALYDTDVGKFVYTTTLEVSHKDMASMQQYVAAIDEAVAQAHVVVIEETILTGQRASTGKYEQIVADVFARFVINMFVLVKLRTVKPEAGMHPTLMNHPLVQALKGDHIKSAARLALYGEWEFKTYGPSAAKPKEE